MTQTPTQQLSSLVGAVNDLRESIEALHVRLDALTDSRRKQKLYNLAFAVGAVVGIALGIVAYVQFQQTSDLRNRVLCPLYKTFLAFEDRSVEVPGLSETERQERRNAYKSIHDGYDVLSC